MKTTDITDSLFLHAVTALDTGNLDELTELVEQHPRLVREPLPTPGQTGYFKDPYLIWFTADNPIRNGSLPPNIVEVLQFLIGAVKISAPETYAEQLNYTLGLVVTGRTPRECGVQIAMMDVLINAGAKPGGAMGALANGNFDAADHLIDRGGELTLASALLLNRIARINDLLATADDNAKFLALTAAAFFGKADIVKLLLAIGVSADGHPEQGSGFHAHGTPLHQAVSSGSLDTVKLLVAAGASLNIRDKAYNGTPVDWAEYMQRETDDQARRIAYEKIWNYLKDIDQA